MLTSFEAKKGMLARRAHSSNAVIPIVETDVKYLVQLTMVVLEVFEMPLLQWFYVRHNKTKN